MTVISHRNHDPLLGRAALTLALLGLLVLLTLAPPAHAAAPPLLREFCATGTGAGECFVPRGMAVDPDSGNVYVADSGNSRINEFSAWGVFIRAWGWDVVQTGPGDTGTGFEICLPANGDTCKAGVEGGGAGQFGPFAPQGIALDAAGDVYAVDAGDPPSNHRVQRFDSEGPFLLMFGGDVNETKVEAAAPEAQRNLCPVDPGDACQVGTAGTGSGQFDFSNSFVGSFITASPDGETIYVGDTERIQEFDTAGHYLGDLPDPEGLLVGEAVKALAVDPAGSLYLSFGTIDSVVGAAKDDVLKLDPATGEHECTLKVARASAIATDAAGHVYVVSAKNKITGGKPIELVQFGGSSCGEQERFNLESEGFSDSTGIATSSPPTCGLTGTDLFIANANSSDSFIRLYGPAPDPDLCPPPSVPPTIDDSYALSVGSESATVRAEINPHFWDDARYYVQYGSGECSAGGCIQQQPVAPGALLTQSVLDAEVTTAGVLLGDLAPDTTYHYRFVASSGGGPAIGPERTLHTYPLPTPPKTDCPNQAFRSGPSARLSDCRAYELVSPLAKNNGDIASVGPSIFQLASPDGERATYSSSSAFGEPQGRPLISQYLSQRDPEAGWLTHSISPPRSSVSLLNPAITKAAVANQFKAFSPDLCSGWFLQDSDVALAPGAPAGVPNLYRRDDGECGEAGYGLITSVAPPGFSAAAEPAESRYMPTIQGISADSTATLFRAPAVLSDEACTTTPGTEEGKGISQVYLQDPTGLHLVSILPSGQPACVHSSAGTGQGNPGFASEGNVLNALSADASRAFFSTSARTTNEAPFSGQGDNAGPLYVRLNPAKPQSKIGSEGCSQPTRACTHQISVNPTTRFWGADPAGQTAIYTAAGALREYDVAAKQSQEIAAGGVLGVMGISEDAARVYFASSAVLSGTQQNSEGDEALAGKPNLYLHERGDGLTFIATLASLDARSTANDAEPPSPIAALPDRRTSRVSVDGLHAAFVSMAPLTGYDNTDLSSGKPAAELYLYDAEPGSAGELRCISCNPGGARPRGRLVYSANSGKDDVWQAAAIPGWAYQLQPSRVLSADGNRLFFESFDSLLLRDTNAKRDVYEWQRAADADACRDAGADLYVPAAGGCLSLISSGQSSEDSYFLDASASGDDVFLTTESSLLTQDFGLVDVYDARVNGGFPPPSPPAPGCEGEACQSPPAAPNDPTPASSSFEGAGNVSKPAGRPRCPKGRRPVKRHGRTRCLKRQRKHQAAHKRRASR